MDMRIDKEQADDLKRGITDTEIKHTIVGYAGIGGSADLLAVYKMASSKLVFRVSTHKSGDVDYDTLEEAIATFNVCVPKNEGR